MALSSRLTSILPLSFHLIPAISCSRAVHTFPSTSQPPPLAKKVPFTLSAPGLTWQDPYYWMRNTNDPDFIDYLNQENSYAQAFMADTENLRRTLFSQMKNRMPARISTPPERWGPWLYYQYIPEGKEYPVLCRSIGNEERGWMKTILRNVRGQFGKEEILLDWNEIAEKIGYVHVGTCRVSPDHNFLAYTLDTSGCEQFMLQIKDLRNGCMVPRLPVDGVVSLAWAQDSKTLFYTISDENQRPSRVLCTKLSSDGTDDIPVFSERDSNFCVDITSTKDGICDRCSRPIRWLHKVHKRVSGVQYFLEHHYGLFYILTNAPLGENEGSLVGNYYLTTCQVEEMHSANWQNIILPGEDISLQDMDIFNGHLVLSLNKKGVPMLCSISLPMNFDCKHQMELENLNPWFFPLPSYSCSVLPGSNHDFMSFVYRAVLSSPVMPDVIVDYDMLRQTFSIVQQEEVRGVSGNAGFFSSAHELDTTELINTHNYKADNYQNIGLQKWKTFSSSYCCETREVVSHDGVKVPLTILFSKKSWQRDQCPGLLQAYGAYGEVLDKSWCADRLSLLDRGWVLAFADVRGGGGDDSSWHKFGSGLYKRNSIDDFILCGNYLVNEGFVCRNKLGAIGYSAGCILVGAAINMFPKLFRAAILKVPFLDICTTLLDPSLPLTTLDYEEFGNPQIQSQFEYIRSYSPYDNIPCGVCCPSMLVTSSFHDSRVGVWEAAKWVAKVREITCSACSRSVILKTNMNGGHFGEGGRYSQCEETAYDYAFLMKVMGS
ncbi:protease 2 isoform X2 [Mangifera indica]|uniref:protease 2 isoform X2 n=1 Tax=Mangifera indica TaxID=29780 RepID=UPI001CFAEC23|nr:protease 2 isoform X2 [Mangifera indica]